MVYFPKFRAWTEEGQVMYYNVYPFENNTLLLSYDDIAYDEVPADDFILMQSTGLLDKNGVEIFEGDILLITIFDNTVKGEVTYSEKDCAFMVDLIDRRYEETQYLGMFTSMQVIGNIYENPVEVEEK